jgi:imidazolonepropionase-like amidohydrolase
MLFGTEKTKENIVVCGARVVDPVAGIDALLDVRVDDGVIAALGTELDTNSHRVIEGAGLLLAPAFVDPHVHLRTPKRRFRSDSSRRSRRDRRGRSSPRWASSLPQVLPASPTTACPSRRPD